MGTHPQTRTQIETPTHEREAATAAPRMSKLRAGLAALAITAVVSGCGFHMVGRTSLPPSLTNAYLIATDQQSDFVQGLRKSLITSGAKLASTSDRASSTVRITTDQVTRKILSVSINNIPREYEITYTVEFSVSSGDKELMAPQRLELTRDYSFNERTMLAKENEEAVLREGMARDLVGIVMRRLSTL